jgi:hypothetical protein
MERIFGFVRTIKIEIIAISLLLILLAAMGYGLYFNGIPNAISCGIRGCASSSRTLYNCSGLFAILVCAVISIVIKWRNYIPK